jgi:hypothetical protein
MSGDAFGPLDTVELRDTLSYATLHMMERLTPPERAAFVLREAFQLPYEQIAEIVGTSQEHCRQLHHRAAEHLADGKDRFRPSATDHAALLRRVPRGRAGRRPGRAHRPARRRRLGVERRWRQGPRCVPSSAGPTSWRSWPAC